MEQNHAKIKLPRLFGDGMVMQRNARVKIWGRAPAGEVIIIRFIGKTYSTIVNTAGEWQVSLRTEDAGGPYDMRIEAGKSMGEGAGNDAADSAGGIAIKNILLGDVWLCSGQSNMEMKMLSVRETYPGEVAQACNDFIRQFLAPVKYDFEKPQTDFESGSWEAVNSQSILNFTAAGYFFAAKLFEQYKIPIGLINASMGGAPAEAFLSEDALKPFRDYFETAQKLKDRSIVDTLNKKDQNDSEEWHRHIDEIDLGMSEGGKMCYDKEYDASAWPSATIPSYWEEEEFGHFYGVVWYRKDIEIPSLLPGDPARLFLGNVIDEDTVYINGIKAGTLPSQYIPRIYDLPEGVLKEGKNTIVIRVVNSSSKGGFYKGKPYHLQIGDRTIDLSGEWKYMVGAKSDPMPAPAFAMWGPSGLYNGMIAPVIRYAIKGVAWYQGESNTKRPAEYESLFKALIEDWRMKWGQGDFPFLYVQLPNFGERYIPSVGNWAALREAQRKTLSVPGTGMAVAIDIGEWNDVHPRNKKGIGIRLALAAQKVAYGDESAVASGPLFRSAERDGNRIILSFSNTGSGLVTDCGDDPGSFEIAEEDKRFVEADARIKDDCVIVWHDRIPNPVHVRYAWADNPENANLYNREGLPASPFTTE